MLEPLPRRASAPPRYDVRDRPPTPHPVMPRRASTESLDCSFQETKSKGVLRRASLSGIGSSLRNLHVARSFKSGISYLSKHLGIGNKSPESTVPVGPIALDTPGNTPRFHDRSQKSARNVNTEGHHGNVKSWEILFPLSLPIRKSGEFLPRRRSSSDLRRGKIQPLCGGSVDSNSVSSQALLKGWLDLKIPHSVGQGWTKVWCAVDVTNRFYLFDSQTSAFPLHRLDLQYVDVVPVPKSKKPWILQLNSRLQDLGHGSVAQSQVNLRLRIGTQEERDEWLKALTQGQQKYPFHRHRTQRLSTPEFDGPRASGSSQEPKGEPSPVNLGAQWNSTPLSLQPAEENENKFKRRPSSDLPQSSQFGVIAVISTDINA